MPVLLPIPPSSTVHLSLGPPDLVLGGGLEIGRLHDIAPQNIFHLGAALGFAFALAAQKPGDILFVQQDFARLEGGASYGLGCELFGINPRRLLIVRTAQAKDALWAMEEGLRCSAITSVIGELSGDADSADLTATRRLSLAAQANGALALLLRQQLSQQPGAAATRWSVASARGRGDAFGGIGRTGFHLALTKNQRGPCGDWIVEWDRHAKNFVAPAAVAVAAPAFDRQAGAKQTRVA